MFAARLFLCASVTAIAAASAGCGGSSGPGRDRTAGDGGVVGGPDGVDARPPGDAASAERQPDGPPRTDVRTGDAPGDAPSTDAGGPAGDAACRPQCAPGARRCGPRGGVQTCVASNRPACTDWAAESLCPANSICAGSEPSAACACKAPPAGCSAPGPFCDTSGGIGICALDAQGCLHAASVSACPAGQACKGTQPAVACACDNSCTAAEVGTHCRDPRTVATCTTGGGCHASVNPMTCPGVKTCQGAAGSAGCQCPAPGNLAGSACATAGARICGANVVLTCASDPAGTGCLVWAATTDCGALAGGGLPCTTASGTAACACPAPSAAEIYVDPVAGSDGTSGVVPTGALTPPACRFRTLGRGLQAAQASGTRVIAATASPPATFGAETFPLVVPAGVILTTGDVTFTPASYTIAFESPSAVTAVELGAGSVLEGYTVQSGKGNLAATAIACKEGAVAVRSVEVAGAPPGAAVKPATGIAVGAAVSDSCAATVTGVKVSGFTVGLSVFSGGAPLAATLRDVTLQDNGQAGPSAGGGGLLIAGGAVTASKLTIRRSGAAATATWGVMLDARGATLVPSLVAGALMVLDTSHAGIELRQPVGMAAPQARLSGAEIRAGAGNEPAIRMLAGSLVIDEGTSVHNGESDGLRLQGGTVTVGATSGFDANGRDGIRVSGGTLTGLGFGASANGGEGVSVTGGTAVLHRVTLASNVRRGLSVQGGMVVLDDGSIVNSNGTGATKASGIEVGGGSLTVGRAGGSRVAVAENGLDGLRVQAPGPGTVVAVTGALVSGSGAHGISVDLDGAGGSVTVTDSELEANVEAGMVVHRAPAGGSAADVVVLANSTVRGSGGLRPTGVGIWLRGDRGEVAAAVRGSLIQENRDVGLLIEQGGTATTRVRLDGNTVTGNNRGAGRPAGGIYFATPSTLDSFTANEVHGNAGDEIAFATRPNGGDTWVLHGPSLACDPQSNEIFCYGPPAAAGVGIRIQPTAPAGTRVDAQNVSWSSPVPTRGLDFDHPEGSSVLVTPACLPTSAVCP